MTEIDKEKELKECQNLCFAIFIFATLISASLLALLQNTVSELSSLTEEYTFKMQNIKQEYRITYSILKDTLYDIESQASTCSSYISSCPQDGKTYSRTSILNLEQNTKEKPWAINTSCKGIDEIYKSNSIYWCEQNKTLIKNYYCDENNQLIISTEIPLGLTYIYWNIDNEEQPINITEIVA